MLVCLPAETVRLSFFVKKQKPHSATLVHYISIYLHIHVLIQYKVGHSSGEEEAVPYVGPSMRLHQNPRVLASPLIALYEHRGQSFAL